MIIGIGLDVVQVKRMKRWVSNPKLMQRYFAVEEVAAIHSAGVGAFQSAAARFAAKEAFGKALGSGLSGLQLNEIVVINDERGKPEYRLSGSALKKMKKAGGEKVFLSLTHEKEIAVAVAVIEGNKGEKNG